MDNKSTNKRIIGAFGESKAVEYLVLNGYKILQLNFRVGKIGELDIIAKLDGVLCFIEVKSRSSLKFGLPCEAIVPSKIRTIHILANIYMQNKQLTDCAARFDVIEVYLESSRVDLRVKNIQHIVNAF